MAVDAKQQIVNALSTPCTCYAVWKLRTLKLEFSLFSWGICHPSRTQLVVSPPPLCPLPGRSEPVKKMRAQKGGERQQKQAFQWRNFWENALLALKVEMASFSTKQRGTKQKKRKTIFWAVSISAPEVPQKVGPIFVQHLQLIISFWQDF